MFTEAELRDALRHSASRADSLPARDVPGTAAAADVAAHATASGDGVHLLAPRRARRGRALVPVAAAAVVFAAVTAAVVVPRLGDEATTAAPPAASTAAGPQAMSQPAASTPVSRPAGRPVDLARAAAPDVRYRFGDADDPEHAAQTLEKDLPGIMRTLTVDVVPAAAVDATRVPQDRSVAIAGTTGYYAQFQLYPIDASTGPESDKWQPGWTVSFQSPGGDWVFVSTVPVYDDASPDRSPTVDDPAMLVAEYERLGVTFEPGTGRVPVRVGHVPSDLRFHSAAATYLGELTALGNYVDAGGLSFTRNHGERSVDVTVTRTDMSQPLAGYCGRGECYETETWEVGAFTVELTTLGYDAAEVQRIRDSIELAPDVADASTWFPLAEAYGG